MMACDYVAAFESSHGFYLKVSFPLCASCVFAFVTQKSEYIIIHISYISFCWYIIIAGRHRAIYVTVWYDSWLWLFRTFQFELSMEHKKGGIWIKAGDGERIAWLPYIIECPWSYLVEWKYMRSSTLALSFIICIEQEEFEAFRL